MSVLRWCLDKFWDPYIWLPPGITWDHLKPNEAIIYADYRHLFVPMPLAFVFLGIRFLIENYCFAPIGLSLGIKSAKKKRAVPNKIMEAVYETKGKLQHKQILALAKQLDWSERQVEHWLHLRRSQDKPTTLKKFCETGWRWLFYTYSFSYGFVCLLDKPWLWDINACWYGYPLEQGVTWDCWWYYMSSLAFYWSLTMSQFFDVIRKDFWQMFIHHIATITLMSFSWVCNLHRIGTLILLVHDCADSFLEAAKLTKYANYQKLCDFLFVVFTLVWISTRLIVYPFYILRSTTIEAPELVAMFPAYFIFNGLLLLLLVLHIYWTYIILTIAYNSAIAGKMDGDIRSSSSEELSEEEPSSLVNKSVVQPDLLNDKHISQRDGRGDSVTLRKPYHESNNQTFILNNSSSAGP